MSEKAAEHAPTPERELGRFAILLGTLVLLLTLVPIVSRDGPGGPIVSIGVTAVLLAGLYLTVGKRWALTLAILLALPTLGAQWLGEYWLSYVLDPRGQVAFRFGMNLLFFALTAGLVLQSLWRQSEVSTDTILGGINVYLLLGLVFTFAHGLLETLQPGAYQMGGLPLTEQLIGGEGYASLSTFIYYSFTTLTTLGYGDISPARPVSQMLSSAEAVVGQLYVAVFIARLVALHTIAGGRRG